MRFSLQDVKKSVQRRGGELAVSLHFLRPGELQSAIEQLIAYHEQRLGQPQRLFSFDDARACIGDYRLANCLIASLSYWYAWRQRDWMTVLQALNASSDLLAFTSPVQLRLALYSYVNEHHQGFLDALTRLDALQTFAEPYHLSVSDLESLLALDTEDEALLTRETVQPPTTQEVATLYNQWVFEAALFNASNVHFVIDCNAFSKLQLGEPGLGSGVGAVIKRLCFLARKLGVYYDLAYEQASSDSGFGQSVPSLLTLTLYGPQEVTGAPQQYGMRLARLCRLLLAYGLSKAEQGRTKRKPSLSSAIVEAGATVHFLQRSYSFVMNAELLQLLPPTQETSQAQASERSASDQALLFDSSIEQTFAEAFLSLAASQGVDGWQLEREPEPLLLDQSIFIPDFALSRDHYRIYVEILGFWTPSYRERKIQKLHQLRGRRDLLLAIPIEAKEAFSSILSDFPVVIYHGQLSATDLLQALRTQYDDFAERLAHIDIVAVKDRVKREGIISERACYTALHCYRRSEIPRAAGRIIDNEIAFGPGIGLYHLDWLRQLKQTFLAWMSSARSASLQEAINVMKQHCPALQDCEDATIETLLDLWPELHIRRDSIFDTVIELSTEIKHTSGEQDAVYVESEPALKEAKKTVRERRPATRKRTPAHETVQGNLWE